MAVIVIGHRHPDTDSICSAISYAALKQQLTGREYIAARTGNIKAETQFALDTFNVAAPELVLDVRSRVSDMLGNEAPITVSPDTPIREVGILARTNTTKSLPVVDDHGRLLGVISLGDITQRYLSLDELKDLERMHFTLGGVLRTMGGRFLVPANPETQLRGKAMIAAMNVETMAARIEPGDVVLVGDREDAHLAALEAGAGCLIVTGGFAITSRVQKKAYDLGTPVLSVPHDTFSTARLLGLSAPVSTLMHTEGMITFQPDDFADDARKVMLETRFRNYPVVDQDNKFIGVVSRYHLLALQRKKVILVDHNEKSQAVAGLDQAQVLEVIDHHRVGDVQTGEPIYFRSEPVGCTATIVAGMYEENEIEPSKEMAGLMLSAILSDTVLFKSPTCTPRDRRTAEKLAAIAGVDIMEYGTALFTAGSSLEGRSAEEIIYQDFKEFHFGDVALAISQVETMDAVGATHLQAELLDKMETIRQHKGLDMTLLMFTDIIKEVTSLLVTGDKLEIIEKVFKTKVENGVACLPGVLSRKKQVVPPLSAYFGM
ncbi:putative manganese-dependent inorganic diphosphatase [Heliophilum fasciatum]|uniref:inorganic diphosphatase n=1 Tax=Heliophilum fasciatum TaxID=35700 RepID=A0A4R2S0C7_9FIRM|nr:putative manganese-dependent inorganic diphosphatase [Heliophilum fasciatum]MCW2276913.1 manganese-dependent inorganic pyrophosphatase [Heliophilum fasciatum]TCP68627.1 manganese-dependent inorganic pyrophosphatase [Heliophilum fasciatum]